jgi:hypothetical protein
VEPALDSQSQTHGRKHRRRQRLDCNRYQDVARAQINSEFRALHASIAASGMGTPHAIGVGMKIGTALLIVFAIWFRCAQYTEHQSAVATQQAANQLTSVSASKDSSGACARRAGKYCSRIPSCSTVVVAFGSQAIDRRFGASTKQPSRPQRKEGHPPRNDLHCTVESAFTPEIRSS